MMNAAYKRIRILMASPFEITVSDPGLPGADAVEDAFQEIARIERVFSAFRPDSPIAQFNRCMDQHIFEFDKEVLYVFSQALGFAQISGGTFDPTAGPLIDLWGFGVKGQIKRPPPEAKIRAARQRVGHSYLRVDLKAGVVERLKPGLCVNLGAIVKGYAVDRAVQILKDRRIKRALVSCGSTHSAFGNPGWRIAIQHPRQKSKIMDEVLLSGRALATSGDYERRFFVGGKRYSHLIDPRSGKPISGTASVSVMAQSAMAADALSTAAIVMGEDAGRSFLEHQSAMEGLIVSEAPDGALAFSWTSGWPSETALEAYGRRDFLKKACAAFLGLMLPGALLRPGRAQAASIRFATEEEALRRMFPATDHFDVDRIRLSGEQLEAAQQMAGKGFRERDYRFWIGRGQGHKILGYALKLNVIGKERPITFLIGIGPSGDVVGLEVLIYRESRGSEVRFERFTNQFKDKTTADPLRLGRDILPISGATLSSRAASYAVRKALALFEVVYKKTDLS